MSMPSLPEPNPNLTKEQALNMILASIALEETALSHIINAEGEKIQHVLSDCSNNAEDILSVNNSVKEMLEVIMQNQMILKGKMEKVLAHIPKPCDKNCCDNCPCINHDCNCNCFVVPNCCCEYQNVKSETKISVSKLAKSHLYCKDV